MNIIREGFVSSTNKTFRMDDSINSGPMLVDPNVASNIYNTLSRLHDSKRKVYISTWRIIITIAFFSAVGLVLYICRTWKLHTEEELKKATVLVTPPTEKYTPPFHEFRLPTATVVDQPWIRKRDWQT